MQFIIVIYKVLYAIIIIVLFSWEWSGEKKFKKIMNEIKVKWLFGCGVYDLLFFRFRKEKIAGKGMEWNGEKWIKK